jgi:hypothetical protein
MILSIHSSHALVEPFVKCRFNILITPCTGFLYPHQCGKMVLQPLLALERRGLSLHILPEDHLTFSTIVVGPVIILGVRKTLESGLTGTY